MSRELPQSLVKKFAKISSHRLITKVIDWFEEDGYDYNDIIEMLERLRFSLVSSRNDNSRNTLETL